MNVTLVWLNIDQYNCKILVEVIVVITQHEANNPSS